MFLFKTMQEEQRKVLEKEAQAKQAQVKLAPWAKKSNHNSGSRDLSLAEIQKLTSKMEEQEGEEVDKEEFQSCFKIRGRPILPPVMTPGWLLSL